MAYMQENNVTQAFRNNKELNQFVLSDIVSTGRVLGNGSYGTVEEVSVYQLTRRTLTCFLRRLSTDSSPVLGKSCMEL
jgi:hypothetical protein